jgi:imidazolonepropionase-like amidohydrolase
MKQPTMRYIIFLLLFPMSLTAQSQSNYLLVPSRVFDGNEMHAGWAVLIQGDKIVKAGPASELQKESAEKITIENSTLLPGLIEGHSHLLLHPYNETSWDDQVMKESDALRVARATVHAEKTLLAGFTTVRDLGSEGAGYSDVGLKQAIEENIIPGPRMLVAGRAIVATGSYGPKGLDNDFQVMLGAEPADGNELIRVVRDQIGKGADIIKVYADYGWGPNEINKTKPTFSLEELRLIVETAKSSGRPVVAHASTAEGMRRAIEAGVETIEHGDGGTPEVFALMKQRGVALCPTIAAGEAVSEYKGWKKGTDAQPARVKLKHQTFKDALKTGVTICAGGDVGVFMHGDNVRELILMVEYGMKPLDVLRSATSINAKFFHIDDLVGQIAPGLKADLIIVNGDPSEDISSLRNVKVVVKNGIFFKR